MGVFIRVIFFNLICNGNFVSKCLTSFLNRDKLLLVAFEHSLIAQLVEHSTVNRVVAGSSPARGACFHSSVGRVHPW
jgi:hypothetical protein